MSSDVAPEMPRPAEPHRRPNPLTGTAALVSAERTRRRWQGAEERPPPEERPSCDPEHESTLAITNDFAALRPDVSPRALGPHPLFRALTQPGTCRVIRFHPRHDLTLAETSAAERGAAGAVHDRTAGRVVGDWIEQ